MKRPEVHVYVERVVLDGVPPELQGRVVKALEGELLRLAGGGTLPVEAAGRTVDGPAVITAEAVGIAAARGVWGVRS